MKEKLEQIFDKHHYGYGEYNKDEIIKELLVLYNVVEHEVQLCRFCKVGDTNNDFGCTNTKCEMYPFQ